MASLVAAQETGFRDEDQRRLDVGVDWIGRVLRNGRCRASCATNTLGFLSNSESKSVEPGVAWVALEPGQGRATHHQVSRALQAT